MEVDTGIEPDGKIIYDLCGGSGAFSQDYQNAGYDVRIITLPGNDVRLLKKPGEEVYGILASPPCTELSLAKNGHPQLERDFKTALAIVDACIRFAYVCDPKFWVLENPVGYLSRWLGQAAYIFHPWWFGDPWTKRTALWGKFVIPTRKYFEKTEVMSKKQIILCRENRKPQDCGTAEEKAYKRSITPAGFAQAFFNANK